MFTLDPKNNSLSDSELATLKKMWLDSCDDILHMTTLATCGHPGGSMSSIHFLLLTYGLANINPNNLSDEDRDRIFVSHGHISPGVYAALARYGFFDREEMTIHFRRTGSRYGGHVEDGVPGIEWNTGNLGQGLSAGVGAALGSKLKNKSYKTVVLMGDGEQQKGQIAEACRTAVKYQLSDLIAFVDYNRYQIGGDIKDIMPQDIKALYLACGWNVIEVDQGNDFSSLYDGYLKAWNKNVAKPNAPTVILAQTKMGFGVSFMEDICDYHGKACSEKELEKALDEIGVPNRLSDLKEKKSKLLKGSGAPEHVGDPVVNVDPGKPIILGADELTDNRSAYGKALEDLAKLNNFDDEKTPIVGISCDLEGSVKMGGFRKVDPNRFLELGIQEHNNAVVAGRLSKEGYQVYFSTFGVFGVDEVYNQQRLNGFNHTNLKTVCTHLGLSVGEDGPTHQSVDYLGLLRNVFGYNILIPADPNQTDHMTRYIATQYGNFFVGMGRAKTPIVTKSDGTPFFDESYDFKPGQADVVRSGTDATIISLGPVLPYAINVSDKLVSEGIKVRVLNLGSVEPVDSKAILAAASETGAIVTAEDHHVNTGIGSIVSQVLVDAGVSVPVKRLGVTKFCSSGIPSELYASMKLDEEGMESELKRLIERKPKS